MFLYLLHCRIQSKFSCKKSTDPNFKDTFFVEKKLILCLIMKNQNNFMQKFMHASLFVHFGMILRWNYTSKKNSEKKNIIENDFNKSNIIMIIFLLEPQLNFLLPPLQISACCKLDCVICRKIQFKRHIFNYDCIILSLKR